MSWKPEVQGRGTRVVEVDEPANYAWVDGGIEALRPVVRP
jgi:hypothetical protein